MNQQELGDLFCAFDAAFAEFCEKRADEIGDRRRWALFSVQYMTAKESMVILFRMPQDEGKEKKIAFSVLLKNTPDTDAMQSLKHYVNTEVRQCGFQGYERNIRLPQGLVEKLLQGDKTAYKEVLHKFCLRYRNALSEEKIEELLQDTIKQTLALKRRNTDTPEIEIFNSALSHLYKQKIARKANFTVSVEHLPELAIDYVDDTSMTPSELILAFQDALGKTPLTTRQKQVITELLANPESSQATIAKRIEGQLTSSRIGQLLNIALEKIFTKAAELGYQDLLRLYSPDIPRRISRKSKPSSAEGLEEVIERTFPDNEPQLVTEKEALKHWLQHREPPQTRIAAATLNRGLIEVMDQALAEKQSALARHLEQALRELSSGERRWGR